MGVKPDPLGTSFLIFKATCNLEVRGFKPNEYYVKLIAGEVMEHENL